MKITQYAFPANQYVQEEIPKSQIFLHHTAGNADPFAVYRDWSSNPERIATCVVVGGKPPANGNWIDGEIAQGFSSKYWAFHLGLKESTFQKYGVPYQSLDRISVAVEICNWGQLTYNKADGKYYNYVNRVVPASEVCILDTPFKGYKFYHAYTDAQIQSVKELLQLWNQRFNIPLTYNPDIFDISLRALRGESGVYTHNSVRTDKVDISPQPKMIAMLKSL
jgi:hypothetical protein